MAAQGSQWRGINTSLWLWNPQAMLACNEPDTFAIIRPGLEQQFVDYHQDSMMHQRVSPEAHTLGDPLGEYRTSMWAWLPLATLLMGFSGYMIWIGLQQTPIDWGAVLFGFGLLLFFAGLAVFGTVTIPWRIHVFDDGMIIQRIGRRDV